MRGGALAELSCISIEGGALSTSVLRSLMERKLDQSDAASYHLEEGYTTGEKIAEEWNRVRSSWKAFSKERDRLDAEPGAGFTRDKLLLPIFERLGYGRLPYAGGLEAGGERYSITHSWGNVPIHLVGADTDLDSRTGGVAGAAKRSPHGLVLEYLNRGEASPWGFVANGRRLRLLRENRSIVRQSYIEFDLEGIIEGESYADFTAFWLLCHQSRVEGKGEALILERWREAGIKEGERALDELQTGMEKAIAALGSGLVTHPANTALREALRLGQASGGLDAESFYHELLRLAYRLIFLFVAEDRDAFLDPAASGEAKRRYAEHYSTRRLRDLARSIRGGGHGDLWRGLVTVMDLLADKGCPDLALPALGSFLWERQSIAHVAACELANRDFLGALRVLAFTLRGGALWPTDFRNLGSEELGSVYESLLELHTELNLEGGSFKLATAGGHERRTTSSYYTGTALVECLLDEALDPLLAQVSKGKDIETSILALKVCDPAMGSGHFLVGAARRIAKALAAVRTGDPEPGPEPFRHALADVVQNCIYGVDLNPLAVELCKISLWMEALEPGRPLSFLDHHLKCGNSLAGTTRELMRKGIPDGAFTELSGDDKATIKAAKKRNSDYQKYDSGLFGSEEVFPDYGKIAEEFSKLASLDETTLEGVRLLATRYKHLVEASEYQAELSAANGWCAAFFQPKRHDAVEPITQEHFATWLRDPTKIKAPFHSLADGLAAKIGFFHWELAFPEVFRPKDGKAGGFDLVLGNPPWDTMSPDAKEFFSSYNPEVRFQDPEGQKRVINELMADPAIAQKWEGYCRDLYAFVNFIKDSGRFTMFAPGNLGKGDFNVYRMFVETALTLTRPGGWAAQLVPEGLYNGANCMAIRKTLFGSTKLSCIYGFENANEVWFEDIDTRMKFCLYAAQVGSQTESFRGAFNIRSHEQLSEIIAGRSLKIPVGLVKEFSPEALAIMELGSQMDIDIASKMYRHPAFGDVSAGPPRRVYMREIDMGNDRDLFSEDPDGVPLYEGRMIDQYDYRSKGYRSGRGRAAVWEDLPFGSAGKSIQPQWRIPHKAIPGKCLERISKFRIGFCDVASPTNERTLIASITPPKTICGHSIPTILFEPDGESIWQYLVWITIANSYSIDFLARMKAALHMTFSILDSLPFPRIDADDPRTRALVEKSLRLTCTGPEMLPLWDSLANEGWVGARKDKSHIPGELNAERRLEILAHIDVLVARDLFSLTRAEMEYILSGFPTQQRYQEERYGEFRSRRLILEGFDQPDMGESK